jgi:potassium-transporting ATPase KdpC subunit
LYQELRSSLGLLIFLTLLTGVGYPLFVTMAGQSLFPHQANGSLVKEGDIIFGSELIGQTFSSDKHFHSRPSAAGSGYDAANSSGNNLAPTSTKLIDTVAERVKELRKTGDLRPIPVDLVTSSGSGLDPDISVAAAQFQASRVAEANNLPLPLIEKLISSNTTPRTFGFLGEKRVNVLAINRALDLLTPVSNTPPAAP